MKIDEKITATIEVSEIEAWVKDMLRSRGLEPIKMPKVEPIVVHAKTVPHRMKRSA